MLGPDGDKLKIVTSDTSCVSPAIAPWGVTLPVAGSLVGQVQSGYVEMIEMGSISLASATYLGIGHVIGESGWVPRDCEDGFAHAQEDMAPNTGGLQGDVTLINVQSGFSFNAKAIALDRFASTGAALGYTAPGDSSPDLASAEPVSIVLGQGEEVLLISEWEEGTADAVSAVLMHSEIINEYISEWTTASRTDWVVTFPTKPYYYEKEWTGAGRNRGRKALALFQRDMTVDKGACDDFRYVAHGREGEISSPGSPSLPRPAEAMCGVSGAFSFFGSGSLTGGGVFPRGTPEFLYNQSYSSDSSGHLLSNFENGYAKVGFSTVGGSSSLGGTIRAWTAHLLSSNKTTVLRADGTMLKDQTRSYIGLPMVGFTALTYTNAGIDLPDGKIGRSIYGVTIPHSYVDKIE